MSSTIRAQIIRDHGRVWDMAGLRNLWGQGWRHTWFLRLLGLDLQGSTFVTKTTTTDFRLGNTMLRPHDAMTVNFRPDSVVLKFLGCHTLNAWGLSGPGAERVLDELAYRAECGAFKALQISYMPVGNDPADQLRQTREFVALLKKRLHRFRGVALLIQLNASCPNTGHVLREYCAHLGMHLEMLHEVGLRVVVKESVDAPFEVMWEVVRHPCCAGLVTTNSVAYGKLPDRIPWQRLFGEKSPLEKFPGGGGYSGPHLLPLVEERIREYRRHGYDGLIAAGGGVRSVHDAQRLRAAGADVLCIGATLANYRPWNSRAVIREAQSWES